MLGGATATVTVVSSLRIVPIAEAGVPIVQAGVGVGLLRVTVNVSSGSTPVSPTTCTVSVSDELPIGNGIVPLSGEEKSAASAPEIVYSTEPAEPLVSPPRATVKVKSVVPEFPSALSASAATIV
jgi:hypothetical protein